jgi:hypothetical protein
VTHTPGASSATYTPTTPLAGTPTGTAYTVQARQQIGGLVRGVATESVLIDDSTALASNVSVAALRDGAYLETAGVQLSTGFTIESWMKLDTVGNQALFTLVDSSNSANYVEIFINAGLLRLEASLNGNNNSKGNLANSSFAAVDNAWGHVAIRMDDSNILTLLVNGSQVGDTADFSRATVNFVGRMPNTTWTLYVGTSPVKSTRGAIAGELRDLQVWDTARTNTDIQGDASGILTGTETGLRVYQPMTVDAAGATSVSNLVPLAPDAFLRVGAAITSVDNAGFASAGIGAPAQLSGSTVALNGTGEEGTSVVLTESTGTTALANTTVGSDGKWALTLSATDGAHTYNLTLTDAAGNVLTTTHKVFVSATAAAPVVIDLNRDGVLTYGEVQMDVNGDGLLDNTHWAGAQDGVLVWDKYQDGQVHDNSQYAFAQYDTQSAANGTLATDLSGLTAAFDSNHDGVFDASDAQFGEFKVWQDANQNGVSDAGEVRSLADWGLSAINLTSDGVVRTPTDGVTEYGHTTATATDGSQVLVGDVAFDFSTLSKAAAGEVSAGVADVETAKQVDVVDLGAGVAYQYAAPTNDTAAVLMDQHLVSSAGVL